MSMQIAMQRARQELLFTGLCAAKVTLDSIIFALEEAVEIAKIDLNSVAHASVSVALNATHKARNATEGACGEVKEWIAANK